MCATLKDAEKRLVRRSDWLNTSGCIRGRYKNSFCFLFSKKMVKLPQDTDKSREYLARTIGTFWVRFARINYIMKTTLLLLMVLTRM